MEHLVEKMKTTVKRGLILRFVRINFTLCSSLWLHISPNFLLLVSEMRNAMSTTPRTSSSTCTQRRARVCLIAGRMYLDICSRWAARHRSSFCCAQTLCQPIQFHEHKETNLLFLGWNPYSLRQEFCHQDGDQVCVMVD